MRRHCSVDNSIKKLLYENKDLSVEEALESALWARNNENGSKGFFGKHNELKMKVAGRSNDIL